MKPLTGLMYLICGTLGMFTLMYPNQVTPILFGIGLGVLLVGGIFKAFGNH